MTELRVDVRFESLDQHGHAIVRDVVVNDKNVSTWLPRDLLLQAGIKAEGAQEFALSSRKTLSRETGYVILRVQGRATVDTVVFAEPGDRTQIGFRALSGLNLRVAARANRLVDAGPIVAGAAA